MSGPKLFAQLTKVDEARREVWGRLVQETPDRSDEIFDYESSKPYFKAWSDSFAEATDGKSLGNLRAMHGKVSAGKFIALDYNDTEKAIDVGAKVVDDNEWNKVLEGCYTGFSIGGSYVGEKKTEKIGDVEVRRYTAKPVEGSLVDLPCVPTAKFFDILKADGAVLHKEFRAPAEQTDEPIDVAGTGEEIIAFGKLLNDSKLSMADAIKAVEAELGRRAADDMLDTVEAIEKREFSTEERKKAAKEGAALPDGSFPIKTVGDLHNAIQAFGRAKDKAKAKAHIIARAKSLGASKELPEAWTKGESEKAAYAEMAADEELIKQALAKPLIDSDSDEAFSSNVAAEVKAGKNRDQAVAIAYAVQRKARNKKKGVDGELKKGMFGVSRFAEMLQSLAYICRDTESDAQYEGDNSPVPMKFRNWLDDGIEIFKEMAEEEAEEMLEELKEHAGVGEDDEIEEAMEMAAKAGALRKRLDAATAPEDFRKLVASHVTAEELMAAVIDWKPTDGDAGMRERMVKAVMAKVGLSAAHKDKVQAIHDHAADMGADCHQEDGEKATPAGNVNKASDVAAQLSEALERIKKLEAQPMPSVVTLRMAKTITKEQDQERNNAPTIDPDTVELLPADLVRNADGSVDYKTSRLQKAWRLSQLQN